MERAWMLVSVLGMVAAAILFFRDYQNAAFVVATLGAVAWFLSYRTKLRSAMGEAVEAAPSEAEESADHDDE